MTTLSVTSSRSKEVSTQSVEVDVTAEQQNSLDILFMDSLLVGGQFPGVDSQKVVCLVNKGEQRFSESAGEVDVTILKLSVAEGGGPQIGIVFRRIDNDLVNSEWITNVGTQNEVRQTTMVPNDPMALMALPAAMAASFYGGHEVMLPAPSVSFKKMEGAWRCESLTDISPNDTETAILTAWGQLEQNKATARILNITQSGTDHPLVL